MKKIAFISTLVAIMAVASFGVDKNFDENFKNSIKTHFKNAKNIKVISTDKLKSVNGLNLVVFESLDTNETIPFFASDDGKTLLSFPQITIFGNNSDKEMVNAKIENLKLAQAKKQQKIVYEIIKTLPKDRFIEINSFDKNNKFITYMVTDPECPYCRKEMEKIVKWLRNSNVKIIFAPVHGKSAYTKAAIMLKEAKKLSPDNQDGIIKILQKYYDEKAVVSDSQASDKERQMVLDDAKKLFSKGAIKGVPFQFTIEK
ncbi:hypothetical protein [Campylobacter geochelonis]|uniref:Thiol peroxidase n=1 Tax=Campylobacter geochelonis TaxID=1780362 RepID=A0A128ELI1_9BACT|nr:hypothetical protein [Campylobacter geochelonis]QKF71791.1 protein disulfide isomerase, DsbG family [Campylobacter geochelonis]CZE47506.1 thiol peroxidase [Campylobacter geochelonis]CZE49371.1 thiol peroxidase [Campylobacter geochelonis]CZE51456.1 thiol peroxidase [Campylobacter geochelonis]